MRKPLTDRGNRAGIGARETVLAKLPVSLSKHPMGSDKRGNSFGSRRSLFGTEGSEVGLLLLGFGLRPLYLNPASLRILVYPETAKAVMERDRLDRKIRSVLLVDPTRPESGF